MLMDSNVHCLYYITACNRTYYGEVGKSYRLTVKKLQKERPFLCHLSFTASGQEHGDFVEVSLLFNIIIPIHYTTAYYYRHYYIIRVRGSMYTLFEKLLHDVVLFTHSLNIFSLFKL